VLAAGYSGAVKRDGAFYAELGSQLTGGNVADIFHPKSTPLYPFLIGLVHLAVDDLELCGLMVSVAAGTLTILAVYWLGRMLFDQRVALLSAFLCAIHPFLVRYSGYVLTEMTYTLTFAFALGVIWWALMNRGWWRYALAGAAVGLSYLARLEGLGLAALLALGTLVPPSGPGKGEHAPRRPFTDALSLVLAGVVFLAVVFPQLYFVRKQMGVWSLTPKAGISAQRHRMTEDEFSRYRRSLTPDKRELVVEAIFDARHRPHIQVPSGGGADGGLRALAARWLRVEGDFLLFLPEIHGPLLLLFLVGLLVGRRTGGRGYPGLYLGGCLLLYFCALGFFQGSRRNLTALVVPMLFWTAVGLLELAAMIARRRARLPEAPAFLLRWWTAAILVVTVALALPMILRFAPRAHWRWGGSADEDVGHWVRRQLGPERTIMALHRTIPFYAGGRFVGLPYAPYEDVMTYARLNGVEALLLGEEDVTRVPELQALAEQVARDREWAYLGRFSTKEGRKAEAYRLYHYRRARPPVAAGGRER